MEFGWMTLESSASFVTNSSPPLLSSNPTLRLWTHTLSSPATKSQLLLRRLYSTPSNKGQHYMLKPRLFMPHHMPWMFRCPFSHTFLWMKVATVTPHSKCLPSHGCLLKLRPSPFLWKISHIFSHHPLLPVLLLHYHRLANS